MSGKQGQNAAWGKWLLIALVVLFVGSIVWSFVYETLLPLLQAGDTGAAARNLLGFPIILIGTAIFAYGGFLFVRDTFGAMQDPQLHDNVSTIRADESPAESQKRARRANLRFLLGSWKAGTLRMALGFALIALGGWLINL